MHRFHQAIAKYVMMNIALFGDPAFKLFVPGVPQTQPAHVALGADGRLVASGPEKWTKYKARCPSFLPAVHFRFALPRSAHTFQLRSDY